MSVWSGHVERGDVQASSDPAAELTIARVVSRSTWSWPPAIRALRQYARPGDSLRLMDKSSIWRIARLANSGERLEGVRK
jgi:hypothetical protein